LRGSLPQFFSLLGIRPTPCTGWISRQAVAAFPGDLGGAGLRKKVDLVRLLCKPLYKPSLAIVPRRRGFVIQGYFPLYFRIGRERSSLRCRISAGVDRGGSFFCRGNPCVSPSPSLFLVRPCAPPFFFFAKGKHLQFSSPLPRGSSVSPPNRSS